MKKSDNPPSPQKPSRLRDLTAEFHELETRLRLGGGADKIERQHQQGKLTARERIDLVLDDGTYSHRRSGCLSLTISTTAVRLAQELSLLSVVYEGREVVVVANDATVKAGSWWPETIKKILRAQEIAMRSQVPIIYLVDSAGVNLPYQGGVFPGSVRRLAYLLLQLDHATVFEGATDFGCDGTMYRRRCLSACSVGHHHHGRRYVVHGARRREPCQRRDWSNDRQRNSWWGKTHNEISGVAHYRVPDDRACIEKIREFVSELPKPTCSLMSKSSRDA